MTKLSARFARNAVPKEGLAKAEDIAPLPRVTLSPDPNDHFLLAMAEVGKVVRLNGADPPWIPGACLARRASGGAHSPVNAFPDST